VSDEDTIASTVDQVQREVGLVDVLVNNAGYGHEGLAEESSRPSVMPAGPRHSVATRSNVLLSPPAGVSTG